MRAVRSAVAIALAVATIWAGAPAAQAGPSISQPANASLGSAATGTSSLSAQLGTVTLSNPGLLLSSATATVVCSNFTTGGGTSNETIPAADIFYWSGPATASSGISSATPGQLTAANAQTCASSITAFTVSNLVLGGSVSWNPTIVVQIPAAAVAGAYTGTITHSAA